MRDQAPISLIESALAEAGTDEVVVLVHQDFVRNVRWARNTVTTNGHTWRQSNSFSVLHDRGNGVPSVGTVSADGEANPAEQIALARQIAATMPPATDAAPLLNVEHAPDWRTAAVDSDDADFADLLASLGEILARGVAENVEYFGYAEQSVRTTWAASSAGLRLRSVQPAARLELNGKSDNRTRSAWSGFAGPSFANADLAAMEAEIRTGLGWQAKTESIRPGHYPAILSGSVSADFMIDLYWGAQGRAAADGRTVFSRAGGGTRLGEQVAQDRIRLFSDPLLAGQECAQHVITDASSESVSLFDNGLGLARTDWISGGVLENLVTTRHTARLTELPLCPAIGNLALDAGGQGDLADLVARTDDALLITCSWYNRMVDPKRHLITGLTRDGVYRVRNGEVVGAVGNFRFNDSPADLLNRVQDASAARPALPREMGDFFTRTTMPALLVDAMNFSSPSEAV